MYTYSDKWIGITSTTVDRELIIQKDSDMVSSNTYQLDIYHTRLICDVLLRDDTTDYPLLTINQTFLSPSIVSKTTITFTNFSAYNSIVIKINSSATQITNYVYGVYLRRKITVDDVDIDYVMSSTGTTHFGIPLIDQDIIFSDDKIIKQGDSIYNTNIQDSMLFESYYKYRTNYYNSIKNALNSDSIYSSYYNNETFLINTNKEDFSDTDKLEFQRWNNNLMTSTLNFERKAGIQLSTINKSVYVSDYRDEFSGGTYYNGDFRGIWSDGDWTNGKFSGWNNVNSNNLVPPVKKIDVPTYYHSNIKYLKENKKYHDIPPWLNKKK